MTNSFKNIENCKLIVKRRLSEMPNHHLFIYAKKQLNFIEEKIQKNGTMKTEDYNSVYIGTMCARELENIDDEFCNAVYAMTTSIMPKNYEF